VIALAVGTTFLLRTRPAPYALVTAVLNTFRYLSPKYIADKGPLVGYMDGSLSLLLLVGAVLLDSARRWAAILAERRRVTRRPAHGRLRRPYHIGAVPALL
jgi:hypothetical protein